MKTFLILILSFLSTSVFALDLDCQSANYGVSILNINAFDPTGTTSSSDGVVPVPSYSRNRVSYSENVSMGQLYLSDRLLAVSLNIDGTLEKFEVTGNIAQSRNGFFPGNIFTRFRDIGRDSDTLIRQDATCSLK